MVRAGSTYRPTALTFNDTSWRGGKPYDAADIPVPNYMVSPGVDRTVLEQQFAYEWYDVSGRYSSGHNPPFTKGSAGRLLPQFAETGVPQRILRGFIRRSDYDVADTKSTARLYFMYNPETITRDYVSYLDQGALDPFNTVFQAGNLVPPPSFMDFDFSLLFDRQEEAATPDNPGVFVDYEYFDLVVRNVVPNYNVGGSGTGGSELPDNGVMMVNPRDITVVFSPNITVQGRPKNARVSFLKFTHRMIPTRMQIDLSIRVTYFGPMKDMVEYTEEQATTSSSVPWNINTESPFSITNAEIMATATEFSKAMIDKLPTKDEVDSVIEGLKSGDISAVSDTALDILNTTGVASGDLNADIAEHGLKQVGSSRYAKEGSGLRADLWEFADCSSWVWGVFASHPAKPNTKMGGEWVLSFEDRHKGHIPSTDTMLHSMGTAPVERIFYSRAPSGSERSKVISPLLPNVKKGDLMFRKKGVVKDTGHVVLVYENDGKNITYLHCGSTPSSRTSAAYKDIATQYTECYRPNLGNPDSPGNRPGIGQNRPL